MNLLPIVPPFPLHLQVMAPTEKNIEQLDKDTFKKIFSYLNAAEFSISVQVNRNWNVTVVELYNESHIYETGTFLDLTKKALNFLRTEEVDETEQGRKTFTGSLDKCLMR